MSSYDELVHEPIKPADNFSGQLFFFNAAANCDKGVAKSGVNGPLMCGSNVDKSISTTLSYCAPASAFKLALNASDAAAILSRPVACHNEERRKNVHSRSMVMT
jgi:hypothetical protein